MKINTYSLQAGNLKREIFLALCSFICLLLFSTKVSAQITYVSSATATAAAGSFTITIAAPSGIQANDFLIAHFSINSSSTDSIRTLSGWTQIRWISNTTINSQYFYKVAGSFGGSEPASYTFDRSGNSNDVEGAIIAYRGVSPCQPIDVENGDKSSNSVTSMTTTSVTTNNANEMVVAFFGKANGGSSCPAFTTTGLTQRYTACSSTFLGVLAADVIKPAGPTGTFTASYTGTSARMTWEVVALRPASLDAAMTFQSATTTQANVTPVGKGSSGNQVIGIQVNASGCSSALTATSFTLNTGGTTDPSVDITNAKLWYTGISNVFAATNQFGSTAVSPNGSFTITGSQVLAGTTNYFWLTYDIPSTAPAYDVVDAQCTSLNIGSPQTPSVTDPAGSRAVFPITFVNYSTGNAISNSTSISIAAPSGIQANDILIAHFGLRNSVTDSILTFSGWTKIRLLPDAPNLNSEYLYKIAAAGDIGATYTFTRSSFNFYEVVGSISAYRGVSTCNPIDVEGGITSGTSTVNSITTSSLTTTYANEMLVLLYGRDDGIGSCPGYTTAGQTQRYVACSTPTYFEGIMGANVMQAASGSTGTFSASYTGAAKKMDAEVIALVPATGAMAFQSAVTIQPNISAVGKNTTNNQVIGVKILTAGCTSPISVTSFDFNTGGTTNPSLDITNAKVWYTGTSSTFAATNQFGSVVSSPNGTFSISGTQALSAGMNYFWLTFDVPTTATFNDLVDAQCTSVTVGSPQTPTVTDPAGSRAVFPIFFVSSSANATANGFTTITINKPANIQANDLLIAHFGIGSNGSDSVNVLTGWNKIRFIQNSSSTNSEYFYKLAGSSEPSSYTFTRSNTNELVGSIAAYRGVSPCNPIDIEDSTRTTIAGNSITTRSVTTTNPNEMLLILYGRDQGTLSCLDFTSSGQTQRYTACTPINFQSIMGAEVMKATAGATGTFTASYTGAAVKMTAEVIALKPVYLESAMSFQSATTTQSNVSLISKNSTNNQIIGIQVVTANCTPAVSLTNFDFNTSGTSNPSVDISNAKVWYTGTSNAFATSSQFGSAVASPNGTFSISGNLTLAQGTNYFWLTYDIPRSATTGNAVDARCTSVTVGTPQTPSVTDPAGSRTIFPIYFINKTTGTVNSSANITISKPSNIQANDILIVQFGMKSDAVADSIKISTLPAGWIKIRNTIRTTPTYAQYINSDFFYKIAGPSEPSSYTFNRSGTNSNNAIVGDIVAYGGVNICNPIDVQSGVLAAGVTTISTPTVTTNNANEMIVALWGREYNFASSCLALTTPATMIQRYNDCSGSPYYEGITGADLMQPAAGATGTFAASFTGTSCRMTSEVIALKPMLGEITPITADGGATSVCAGATLQMANASAGGTWSTANGTGQASVSASGLVTGVSAGTDTVIYTYISDGCNVRATYLLNVTSCNFTFNIKFFIQGYYIGNGTMSPLLKLLNVSGNANDVDTVKIELHNSSSPYATAFSASGILKSDGSLAIVFPGGALGNSYFIVIKHRNSIETWSNGAQLMTAGGLYDFTPNASKAYGNNLVQLDGTNYGIYSGTISGNTTISAADKAVLQAGLPQFKTGVYDGGDLNGDGFVDEDDYRLILNNLPLSLSVQRP